MNTDRQLEYLADQIATLEAKSVDPERIGFLAGQVESLRRDLDTQNKVLALHMEKTDIILRGIQETLSEAKGGWKMMMLIGGSAGSAGAFIGWAFSHLRGTP